MFGMFKKRQAPPSPPTHDTEDRLCLVFIPALVTVLLHAEKTLGRPLTEPEVIALRDKAVCVAIHSALKQLVTTFRDSDAPIECTMPHLLEQTIDEVKKRFGVPSQRAREITGSYYNRLLARLTVEKIANLYWHDTPSEMAKRSYYRVELDRDDSEFEYLDWRRKH